MSVAIYEEFVEKWRALMAEEELLEVAELALKGFTYAEIAEKLGISTNQARRMLTLVRQRTREAFPEESTKE